MNLHPSLIARAFVLVLILACIGCAGGRAPQSPAESKPATPLEILRNRESRVQWDPASTLEADLDQDGKKDAALLGFRKDGAVVGIVQGPMSARSRTWTLEFSWKGGGQYDLCSKEVGIDLERLEEIENPEEKIPAEGMGINLHDDRCDAFHIYWDPKKQRFEWWRL
jgi:hypothetical protein